MNNYKMIRLWKGLTTRQAAQSLGLSLGTVAAVENGQRTPTNEVRAAYAKAFPINNDFFVFVESFKRTSPLNYNTEL